MSDSSNPAIKVMALVPQYAERFGRPVPAGGLKSVPIEEVIQLIEQALATGTPVPGWDKLPVWASDLRKTPLVEDGGPDSEMRGWKQHLKQGKPKG